MAEPKQKTGCQDARPVGGKCVGNGPAGFSSFQRSLVELRITFCSAAWALPDFCLKKHLYEAADLLRCVWASLPLTLVPAFNLSGNGLLFWAPLTEETKRTQGRWGYQADPARWNIFFLLKLAYDNRSLVQMLQSATRGQVLFQDNVLVSPGEKKGGVVGWWWWLLLYQ